ncbi:hypothetical protein HanIR_Chr01g0010451 [Helianthus annuus]|nr:hypothetical protein HanIR_Chr01g0010451 [Helianthus annuus]
MVGVQIWYLPRSYTSDLRGRRQRRCIEGGDGDGCSGTAIMGVRGRRRWRVVIKLPLYVWRWGNS